MKTIINELAFLKKTVLFNETSEEKNFVMTKLQLVIAWFRVQLTINLMSGN